MSNGCVGVVFDVASPLFRALSDRFFASRISILLKVQFLARCTVCATDAFEEEA